MPGVPGGACPRHGAKEWAEAERGLSPADLAMHVVLPEVDGRLFAGVVSFKQPGKRDPDLEYSRFAHRADAARITAVADPFAAWHRLSELPKRDKAPGFGPVHLSRQDLAAGPCGGAGCFGIDRRLALTDLKRRRDMIFPRWPISAPPDCRKPKAGRLRNISDALENLPQALRDDLTEAWGDPRTIRWLRDGAFHFPAIRSGKTLIASAAGTRRCDDPR